MDRFLRAFTDELVKVANPGFQATIDAKLAPLKPPAPPPMQGPSAMNTAPKPAAPLEQRMQDNFKQIQTKATAGAAKSPFQVKTPMAGTELGVRG